MKFSVSLRVVLLLVASATAGYAETLLRAPSEAPSYRLGKIRIEDDRFGRAMLVFDFTRTREGEGYVRLIGRSPDGPLHITSTTNFNRAQGEVRLNRRFGSRGGGYDYEFYLVTSAGWAGKSYGDCLVSNKVQLGNPGSSPSARRLNAEEQAAYEKNKLKEIPPDNLPTGYQLVRFETPVATGMRVKAGYYGDWIDTELLQMSESGQATVRVLENDKLMLVKVDGWLAASSTTLERAATDPSSFYPTLRVLPGGTKPLPSDGGPIPPRAELPRGMPLLMAGHSQWEPVVLVDDLGGRLKVVSERHRDTFGTDRDGKLKFVKIMKRSELAVSKDILDSYEDSTVAKGWAVNLIPKKKKGFGESKDNSPTAKKSSNRFNADDPLEGYHVWDKNHKSKQPIPKRAQKLPHGLEIPTGTPIGFCNFSGKWVAGTVLLDEEDTVVVTEDDSRHDTWAYRFPRYQVIIQNKALRGMKNKQSDKLADLKKTLRTWTDSTGEHKVEARFVRIKDKKAILKTDAGREITLPLNRLSEEDRELLEGLELATDNPFE